MKKIVLIAFLSISFYSISQDVIPFHKDYDWSENSNELLTKEIKAKEIAEIKSKIVKEFTYNELGNLVEYNVIHKAFWLNSDEEIERHNKIYLPYNQSSLILKSKARVINKNGDIILLDESKIMTSKNEETGEEYKYFAFEGVEKGSIVEHLLVVQKEPSFRGSRITLQNDIDKYNLDFDLFSPNNLLFKFKSFNGLDSIVMDTTLQDKQHWELKLDYLEKLEDEEFSAYKANKKYLIYKLDYNSVNQTSNITSYNNIANGIFDFYHADIPKKQIKTIKKLMTNTDVELARDYKSKIRTIEDYIKANYYLIDSYNPQLSDLTTVLDQKIGNTRGIIKLYIEMFKLADIKHELVLTTNRFDMKFDQEFEANNYLNDYLFYFPKIDAYLTPDDNSSRIGFPSPDLTECYGLFIKEVKVGNFVSGVGKIKYIGKVDYKKNFDILLVDVSFDSEDLTKTILKIDRSSGGYYIKGLQPYMNILKDKDKAIDELITFIHEDIKIIDKVIYNDDADFFGKAPLRVVANAEATSFVEKAGENYLLKVGEFIGPQHEMYEEKERKQPIEEYYRKDYHRVITVNIPEGYEIKNLSDINIDENFELEGNEIMKFQSSYILDKNTLTITADEYYNFIRLDKKYFNDYRRVMNGAADFNKITLVLEKK